MISEDSSSKRDKPFRNGNVAEHGESITVPFAMMDGARGGGIPFADGLSLLDAASAIAGYSLPEGMSDRDMRAEAVRARLGHDATAGLSEACIAGKFDALLTMLSPDAIAHRKAARNLNSWRDK